MQLNVRLMTVIAILTAVPMGIALAEGGLTPKPEAQAGMSSPSLLAATQIVADAQRARAQVGAMVESARRRGDLLLLTCVMDKQQQLDALVGKAQARLDSMQQSPDPGLLSVGYVVITVVGEKASRLVRDAGQCVGKETASADRAMEIQVTAPAGMPAFEPLPADGIGSVAPPPPGGRPSATTVDPSTDVPVMPNPASPTM